jgi:hypothetical protein
MQDRVAEPEKGREVRGIGWLCEAIACMDLGVDDGAIM